MTVRSSPITCFSSNSSLIVMDNSGVSNTHRNCNWNEGGIRGLTFNLGGKCNWRKVPILTHMYQYDLIFIQEHRMNISALSEINLSGYRKLQSSAKIIYINKMSGEQCDENDGNAVKHNIHGLLIFISKRIKFRPAQPLIHPKSIESRSIMVSTPNNHSGNSIIFHCIYQSHRARRGHLDVTQLQDRPGTHYLLGDFNALHPDWCHPSDGLNSLNPTASPTLNSPFVSDDEDGEVMDNSTAVRNCRINSLGRGLKEQLDASPYENVNKMYHGPTTIHGTTPDLVITTAAQAEKTDIEILDYCGDVHFAINFFINTPLKLSKENFKPSYKYEEANWDVFEEELDKVIKSEYKKPNDLNEGIVFINSAFQSAMDKSIPKTKFSKKPYRCWFWNKECSQAMNKTRKLKNAVRNQRRRGVYKPNIVEERKKAEEEELAVFEKARSDAWNRKLQRLVLDKNVSGLRKTILSIFNDGVPPLGPCVEDPQAKANELAKQFSSRCQNSIIPDSIRTPLDDSCATTWQIINDYEAIESLSDNPITLSEVEEAIRCNKKSTPGSDGIPYLVTCHSTTLMIKVLLDFFNLSFEKRKLPDLWKLADMLGIPKPLDKGAFRPITLLAVLCKIMEKIIERRIITVQQPFSNNTFGFQPDLGTSDALVCFVAQSSVVLKRCSCHVANNPKLEAKDKKDEHVHVKAAARANIYIKFDFSKAFELARPEIICYNMVRKGISGKILSWVKDYILERKGRVKFDGCFSEYVLFENGTPQGSILSPNSFNRIVENTLVSSDYPKSVSLGGYADDVKLQLKKPVIVKSLNTNCKSVLETQTAIDIFTKRSRDQGLILNIPKTYADYIGSAIPRDCLPTFTSNEKEIPWAYDIEDKRYLGVYFDRNLTFQDHVDMVEKKVAHDIGLLKMMAGASDGTSTLTMLKFYIMCIRPKIEFGIVCMLGMDSSALNKLEVIQNNCLRMILGVRRDVPIPILHIETGCLPIRERRDLLTLRFFGKLRMNHENHPLLDIFYSSGYMQDEHLYPDTNYCKQLAKLCKGFSAFKEEIAFEDFSDDPLLHIPTFIPKRAPSPPWQDNDDITIEILSNPKAKNLLSPEEKEDLAMLHNNFINDFLQSPDSLAVFTDGSIDDDKNAGYGIYITDGRDSLEESCGRLASHCGTVTVELKAIEKALSLIKSERYLSFRNILIFSDSQGALAQIGQTNPSENIRIYYHIMDLISMIQDTGAHITFRYVPSHVGVEGNEIADSLAKKGAELQEPTDSIDNTFSYFKCECNKYINSQYDTLIRNTASDSTSLARYLHINPNLSMPILNAGSRMEQLIINNLRSHSLNKCTHYCPDIPICTYCSEPFDAVHYLFECPANTRLSNFCKNMLGSVTTNYDFCAVSEALRGAIGNITQFGILTKDRPPRASCSKGHGVMIFHGRMRPF